MQYSTTWIADSQVPRAAAAAFQHLVDTYASETNKTASVWRAFVAADMDWRPHPRSSSVAEIMKHQLLSERRLFAEFLGSAEPGATDVLPAEQTAEAFTAHLIKLAAARLPWLASQSEAEWLRTTQFFDVKRERIWVFWRRVLHSAHHRTQLTVYLRLLNKTVPATYGPSADVTWSGADPTLTVEAAERGG
ncbi:MAG: DinB family protein [Acidobacteriia bacterium]|nr:DinB family protein [Terriglobia bacterium]